MLALHDAAEYRNWLCAVIPQIYDDPATWTWLQCDCVCYKSRARVACRLQLALLGLDLVAARHARVHRSTSFECLSGQRGPIISWHVLSVTRCFAVAWLNVRIGPVMMPFARLTYLLVALAKGRALREGFGQASDATAGNPRPGRHGTTGLNFCSALLVKY